MLSTIFASSKSGSLLTIFTLDWRDFAVYRDLEARTFDSCPRIGNSHENSHSGEIPQFVAKLVGGCPSAFASLPMRHLFSDRFLLRSSLIAVILSPRALAHHAG